jgi:hypothetical protein
MSVASSPPSMASRRSRSSTALVFLVLVVVCANDGGAFSSGAGLDIIMLALFFVLFVCLF